LPYDPPAPYAERFPESPYDGEIAFVDYQVGKILANLEGSGLLDSTLIVVTSDHGEAFGEHVEEGHGLLTYNETLRVPLIVYAPEGLSGGRVIPDPVGIVEVAPTLAELCGLEPGDFDGGSLVALLEGAERPEPSLYFESLAGVDAKNWAPRTGILARGHKFIDVPEPELYDLEADPLERHNLLGSSDPTAAEMRTELRRELRDLVASEPGESSGTPGTGRDLDEEDRRHLSALGYLSTSAGGATRVLDPKRGIVIDMQTRNARTLIKAGEPDRAEAVIEKLRTDHPDVEVADYYELEHEIAARRGDVEGATAALAQGTVLFPAGALELKLAAYQFENGNLDESERIAEVILERDPKLSQAINLLGMVEEKRGRPEQALARFEEALALEPTSIPLLLRIADVQSQLGRGPQALEIYERLLTAGSLDGSADHLYRAAALNAMAGHLPRAEELFRRGLALEPAGRHYLALAMVQLRAQKPGDAAASLETALGTFRGDLEPNDVLLAEVLLRQAGGRDGSR
ncbi:MAG: sulfatase-like hydrolase/transferase, partial [bacterium]|nr:sulfatase-like hydrolase/transferase [bacterium]